MSSPVPVLNAPPSLESLAKRPKAFPELPAYHYTPLSSKTPQIRLLTLFAGDFKDRLEGSLSVATLADLEHDQRKIPNWEALSYCWRSSVASRILLISGQVLEITDSLHVALQHLRRKDGKRTIWIDQVCINQDDIPERNEQVNYMKIIYKKSGRVIAWLGTGDQQSHQYMEFLAVIKDLIHRGLYPRTEKPTYEEELILFEALTLEAAFRSETAFAGHGTHDAKRRYLATLCQAFCGNDWFERLWIVQEAVLATHMVLQYGHVTVDWNVHSKACLELLWKDLVTNSKLSGSGVGLTDTIQMLKEENYGSSSRNLVVLLSALKYQKTSDARDRVYGIMGIAELHQPIKGDIELKPDYQNPVDQLAAQLTLYCLQTEKTLDILSICCSGEESKPSGQPSWTMDMSSGHSYCDQLFSTERRTLDFFSAGTSHPVQYQQLSGSDILTLKGSVIDTIKRVSPEFHSTATYGIPNTEVWSQWKDMALQSQAADPYGTTAGRLEAFWRTLITDQVWDDPASRYIRAPDHIRAEFERWSRREHLISTVAARDVSVEEGFYDFVANLMVGNQARLFRTQRGYLGLACRHVRAGDTVAILWGGHLPFILREVNPPSDLTQAMPSDSSDLLPTGTGRWNTIGTTTQASDDQSTSTSHRSNLEHMTEAQYSEQTLYSAYKIVGGHVYVHGIMHGEVSDLGSQIDRPFWQFSLA